MPYSLEQESPHVLIFNGQYNGHHPIMAVPNGINPINPNHEPAITPYKIIATPTTILSILSMVPIFFDISYPFFIDTIIIIQSKLFFSNLSYIREYFNLFSMQFNETFVL